LKGECDLDISQLFLLVLVSLGKNGDDLGYLRLFFKNDNFKNANSSETEVHMA